MRRTRAADSFSRTLSRTLMSLTAAWVTAASSVLAQSLQTYPAASFTVQYPQGWQVISLAEDNIEIVSDPAAPLTVHTQVQLFREDPAIVVGRSLDQLIASDALILRYRTVAINGQSALRVWLGEQPHPQTGQPCSSLLTFVGYGSAQTAVLTSYYDPNSPEAEALLVELHDSFSLLVN